MRQSLAFGVGMGLLAALCVTARGEGVDAELSPPSSASLQVLLTTSEFVAGRNRLAFGLLKDDTVVDDARVTVGVYDLDQPIARPVAETPAVFHKLEVVEQGRRVHVHPDGARHLHDGPADVRGIYVAQVTLTRPGPWGLEILAQRGHAPVDHTRLRIAVLPVSPTPAPGMPAPRSRNLTASDVSDLKKIDSSEPPDPRLHQARIADTIAQHKPQLIVFATPKYCTSRVCGPMVDVVRSLIPAHGKRVVFIHQEIWEIAFQKSWPVVDEWNLRSEPWTFIVDRDGIIRAKFEGLATRRELEAALRQALLPRGRP